MILISPEQQASWGPRRTRCGTAMRPRCVAFIGFNFEILAPPVDGGHVRGGWRGSRAAAQRRGTGEREQRRAPHVTFTAPLLPGRLVLMRARGSVAWQRRRYGRKTTDVVRGMAPPPRRDATRTRRAGGGVGGGGQVQGERRQTREACERASAVPSGLAASSPGSDEPSGAALHRSRSCLPRA